MKRKEKKRKEGEKKMKTHEIKRYGGDDGEAYLSAQARVTPKGAVYFREVYGDYCEEEGLMEV